MKKLTAILLLALLCIGLAACGGPAHSDKLLGGQSGNFYDEFIGESGEDSYTVTATAYIEDELTIVYLNNPGESAVEIAAELTFSDKELNGWEIYGANGQGEELLWRVEEAKDAPGDKMVLSAPLTVAPGESRLFWRSEDGAAGEFKLVFSNLNGVEVSMHKDKGLEEEVLRLEEDEQPTWLEVYAPDGTLLNTVDDADSLNRFCRVCCEDFDYDSYEEQKAYQREAEQLSVLYTVYAYKEPVALINDGSPETLFEITLYADSNLIKEVIVPEAVDALPILGKVLTFYLEMTDADHDFLLSLAEN